MKAHLTKFLAVSAVALISLGACSSGDGKSGGTAYSEKDLADAMFSAFQSEWTEDQGVFDDALMRNYSECVAKESYGSMSQESVSTIIDTIMEDPNRLNDLEPGENISDADAEAFGTAVTTCLSTLLEGM